MTLNDALNSLYATTMDKTDKAMEKLERISVYIYNPIEQLPSMVASSNVSIDPNRQLNYGDKQENLSDLLNAPMHFAKYRDLAKLAKKQGYEHVRSRGSHNIFKDKNGKMVVIPDHGSKDIGKGLMKKIMKMIGLGGGIYACVKFPDESYAVAVTVLHTAGQIAGGLINMMGK